MAHDDSRPLRPSGRCDAGAIARAIELCRAADALVARGLPPAALTLYEHATRELEGVGSAAARELPPGRVERAREELVASLGARVAREAVSPRWLAQLPGLRRAAAVGLALLVLAGFARLLWVACYVGEISGGAVWTASSATEGAAISGRLPQRGIMFVEPKFFFHTRNTKRPWLLLDLGRVRSITRLELVNRLDCCYERAAALEVEVSRDGRAFAKIAARNQSRTADKLWSIPVSVSARFVRVTSRRTAPLHLADLRVFGR